jgi:hypothetical protein
MEQSENLSELAKALVAVQKVLKPAPKDSQNPHFKSKYADLESVMETVREPLASAGLAIVQTMEPHTEGVIIVTTLLHDSGQWLRGKCLLKPQRNDPQGIGSCITYGRRYGAAAIVGLHQTDDDGEAASGRGDGGKNGSTLTPPAKLSDRAARPPEALSLTGEDDPLITATERRKLDGLLTEFGVSTEDCKAFLSEKFQITSRAEVRRSMLPTLGSWIRAHKKAVA